MFVSHVLKGVVLALALTTGASKKFIGVYPNSKDSSVLHLDIPFTSLEKSFVTHAIFNKATLVDGKIPEVHLTRNWDVEAVRHTTFHFELSEDKKYLNYVQEQYDVRTTDEQLEYTLKEGAWTGRLTTLPIIAVNPEGYAVDATRLIKNGFGIASPSYLGSKYEVSFKDTVAFEKNANLVINYEAPTASYSVAFSLMQLPEDKMPTRQSDDRVGYFSTTFTDLGYHHGVFQNDYLPEGHQSSDVDSVYTIINRRRLQNDENGNVIKPIVYYIDHSVPEMWREYFKQGVEVWNVAFEKAGFKNAIKAILPGDADWPEDYHVGDFRFDTISFSVYTGSGATAVGPSITDPRTGEILLSNIVFSSTWAKIWLQSVESDSVHLPKAPSAKTNVFHHRGGCPHARLNIDMDSFNVARLAGGYSADYVPKEVVGAAFKDVTAHEVGHTLGLRHNFLGSLQSTPEELMNKDYTDKHGIATTFMDYVPVNIWSEMTAEQAKNHTWFQPTVGSYDIAAITYGYKELDREEYGVKHPELFEIAEAAPEFATDYERVLDFGPYAEFYDLGSDPAFFYADRIALAKKLRQGLFDRAVKAGDSWVGAYKAELRLLNLILNGAEGLGKYIGGAKVNKMHRNDKHPFNKAVEYISKEKQLEALRVMLQVAAAEDNIFIDEKDYLLYVDRIRDNDEVYAVKPADMDRLTNLIRSRTLAAIFSENAMTRVVSKSTAATLSVSEIFHFVTDYLSKYVGDAKRHIILSEYFGYISMYQRHEDIRLSGPAQYEHDRILKALQGSRTMNESPLTFALLQNLKK